LVVNFISNEIKNSFKKLELKYLNNFLVEIAGRARDGGKIAGLLWQEIQKRLSSAELLAFIADPGPSKDVLAASYEDLRWLLYQLPPAGVAALTAILPKTASNFGLWCLLLEIISYEVAKSGGKSINILTQLNERALVKVVEMTKASFSSFPSGLLQSLAKHKAGAVREATAKALMECDPDIFHSVCAHMALDSDTKVAKLVRPVLATRRNPVLEGILFSLLRNSYTRNRHGDELNLLDNYRLYGNTASPRAVDFLEEVLLRKDFKTFISRTVDPHKTGAALALFMMPSVEAARNVLEKAGKSSFRNVRQAFLEAERIAKGNR
jgi:hypothetical protein